MNTLTAQEILEILPHRYPFVMIDKVENYTKDELIAIKNFTINEPYVQGHFPGNHIMPGVMMVEAMAQASTILAFKYVEEHVSTEDLTKYFKGLGILFVGADELRFKRVVYPGDQLKVHSKLTRNVRNIFEFETRIEVNNLIVAEAKLKALAGLEN
jgi:3-hydroxyacyl-[acyl-carrier-protein] dehydratase